MFPGAVNVTGVVHVGACGGEEIQEHINLGAKRIIWVEANQALIPDLLNNVMRHEEAESIVFPVACSDVDDQEVDFNILDDPGNRGCSSLFDLVPGSPLAPMYKGKVKVKTMTLDTIIKRSGFDYKDFQLLDMDVQGAELLVLDGAKELLKNINYICAELTFYNPDYENNPLSWEIVDYLDELGFDHICNNYYPGVSAWGDGYFVRRELV